MTTRSHVLVPSTGTVKLATSQYTDGANVKDDEVTVPGEYHLPTYTCIYPAVSLATSAQHVAQLLGSGSLFTRIRRIYFVQAAAATTAAELTIQILRITTAGTGGAAITPSKHHPASAGAGATGMATVVTPGTESSELARRRVWLIQTIPTGGQPKVEWELSQLPNEEPWTITNSASAGIVLKVVTGRAAATGDLHITFVEAPY